MKSPSDLFDEQYEKNKEFLSDVPEFNMATSSLARSMVAGLLPTDTSVPDGATCRLCGSVNIRRTIIPMGGPLSGRITCNDCNMDESVINHVVHKTVSVTPVESEYKIPQQFRRKGKSND